MFFFSNLSSEKFKSPQKCYNEAIETVLSLICLLIPIKKFQGKRNVRCQYETHTSSLVFSIVLSLFQKESLAYIQIQIHL